MRAPLHAIVVLLALCSGCAVTASLPPRAAPFAGGPYGVAHRDHTFVNPWPVVGDAPRRLRTRIWFPRDAAGPHPLVVYSHGYFSTRGGATYLAEALASRGWVVAAPEHPLTARRLLGDRRADDVVNQPGDLSAVIGSMLAWDPPGRPFAGTLDPQRIAVVGLSLGAMTATLAAYHPELRDSRIAAAVSLGGPMTIFGSRFFASAAVPFLMVAGDADVIVDYRANAPLVLDRVADGALVTIAGGSHTGFDDAARVTSWFIENPDRIACWFLRNDLDLSRGPEVLTTIGAPANGLIVPVPIPQVCVEEPPRSAIAVARQQLITTVAVAAFLESRLAPDADARRAAAVYLDRWLAVDFPDATYRRSAMRIPMPASSSGDQRVDLRRDGRMGDLGGDLHPTGRPAVIAHDHHAFGALAGDAQQDAVLRRDAARHLRLDPASTNVVQPDARLVAARGVTGEAPHLEAAHVVGDERGAGVGLLHGDLDVAEDHVARVTHVEAVGGQDAVHVDPRVHAGLLGDVQAPRPSPAFGSHDANPLDGDAIDEMPGQAGDRAGPAGPAGDDVADRDVAERAR